MHAFAAPKQRNPMTMSISAIDQELQEIDKRDTALLELEERIVQQHMEDTDRCLALRAARNALTWALIETD